MADIALHVGRVEQRFNTLDPAPLRERDLDPVASDDILERCEALPAARGRELELLVHLDQAPATASELDALQRVMREAFTRRANGARRRLQQLFSKGRLSLVISLVFLASMVTLGDVLPGLASSEQHGQFLQESGMIIGWVALWRARPKPFSTTGGRSAPNFGSPSGTAGCWSGSRWAASSMPANFVGATGSTAVFRRGFN